MRPSIHRTSPPLGCAIDTTNEPGPYTLPSATSCAFDLMDLDARVEQRVHELLGRERIVLRGGMA